MNEFEHQPVVGVDAGPVKEEERARASHAINWI